MLVINITKITSVVIKKNKGETFKQDLNTKHREGTLENAFSMYLAYLIVKRVQEAVKLQQLNGVPMKTLYKPLSNSYNKSKPKQTQDKFWKNSDYLIKNLKIWRNRASIYLGYHYSAKHPSNGANITDVMKYNEFGTKKMQARSLFKPVVQLVIKNSDIVVQSFLSTIKKNGGIIPPQFYTGA